MVTFEIPGIPKSKKRPKFARRGNFVSVYNCDKKEDDDKKILIKALWTDPPIKDPVELYITFFMPIPKSLSKKKQTALLYEPHAVKADLDNLLKKSIDQMNGIVYVDDRQIWSINSKKVYSDNPRTLISICHSQG